MKISFKLFTPIIESKTSPHGFTLRSSFKRKLLKTFTVFVGLHHYDPKTRKITVELGIFDYCTLCIPVLMDLALDLIDSRRNLFSTCLIFFIWLVSIPFDIVGVMGGIAFVLIALPVVGIVHLVSEFVMGGEKLKEAASNLQIIDKLNQRSCSLKKEFNTFSSNKLTLIIEPFDNFKIKIKDDEQGYKFLEIKKKIYIDKKGSEFVGNKICYLPVFRKNPSEPINNGNIKALQALIKLNAGDVTRRLEKTEEGKTLLDKIMSTSTP